MHAIARIRTGTADLVGGLVLWVPGRIGSLLRVGYFRARGAKIAGGVRLDLGVAMDAPHLVHIGTGSWIDRYAVIIAGLPRQGRETRHVRPQNETTVGRVVIGSSCHIGAHVVLSGIGGLVVGDAVTIAAGTKVYSLSHHYRSWQRPWDRSIVFGSQVADDRQSMLQGPITLGDNVGIGADSLILPGTSIGPDSFVRPYSMVSGDWPSNSLLAGQPAVIVGQRFPDRPEDA